MAPSCVAAVVDLRALKQCWWHVGAASTGPVLKVQVEASLRCVDIKLKLIFNLKSVVTTR